MAGLPSPGIADAKPRYCHATGAKRRNLMETTQAFSQVPLPDEALAGGLAALSEEKVPWWPVAILALEPSEIEQRYHIKFYDSFDNLDYLKVAVLDLCSGVRVALKRHRGTPGPGTDICVPEEIFKHDSAIVSEVVDALGLHPDDVLWSRPQDD